MTMDNAAELVIALSARGINLTPQAGRLRVRPESRLGDTDPAVIRANKSAIIRLLEESMARSDAAVEEAPRALRPRERAAVASLIRHTHRRGLVSCDLATVLACPQSRVVESEIRDAIAAAEEAPPMRAHLLTLAKALGYLPVEELQDAPTANLPSRTAFPSFAKRPEAVLKSRPKIPLVASFDSKESTSRGLP